MIDFELLGNDSDEVRLLRAPSVGYSIALAGRPFIESGASKTNCYDCVVHLRDISAHHGFRIDVLPRGIPTGGELAAMFAKAYATARAATAPEVWTISSDYRPKSSVGGAQAIYSRKDVEARTMEQVWVVVRPSSSGLLALYHTTWFRNEDVNVLRWGHLRASFIDQHEWDPAKPRDATPSIWPPSDFALSLGKARFDRRAVERSRGKGGGLGLDDGRARAQVARRLPKVRPGRFPPANARP